MPSLPQTPWHPSSALSWQERHSRCRVLFCSSNRDATRSWRYCRPSPVATCLSILAGVGWALMFPSGFGSTRFVCFRSKERTNSALCVDEESALVVERSAAGEEFFDAEGNLSPALKPVFDALMHVERSRRVTDLAVAALAQAGVIRPWPIKLKTDQGEQAISGLHRIDEAALRALPDDVFLKLRKACSIAHRLRANVVGGAAWRIRAPGEASESASTTHRPPWHCPKLSMVCWRI